MDDVISEPVVHEPVVPEPVVPEPVVPEPVVPEPVVVEPVVVPEPVVETEYKWVKVPVLSVKEEKAQARMFDVRPEQYKGNLYMLIGKAAEALRENGQLELVAEMNEKASKAPTFELALIAIQEYVSFR